MSGGDAFTIPEARLAEALGVARGTLRDARSEHLEKGKDWDHSKDKRSFGTVCYSLDGVRRTLPLIGVPAEKIALLTPPSAEAPAVLDLRDPAFVEIEVVRIYATNRRIVTGQFDGREVRVRVRNSEKLRRGMTLRCTHESGDIYELADRLPRRPGTP